MIFLFEQYIELLNEGRDANLYHGFSNDKILDLLKDDIIYGRGTHKIDKIKYNGNSLTRNNSLIGNTQLRITFDQAKLIERYKIIPIDGEKVFHKNDSNDPSGINRDRTPNKYKKIKSEYNLEYSRYKNGHQEVLAEEFVIGDIKNAHKYIKKIELFNNKPGFGQRSIRQDEVDDIEEYCNKYNIIFEKRKVSELF